MWINLYILPPVLPQADLQGDFIDMGLGAQRTEGTCSGVFGKTETKPVELELQSLNWGSTINL